MESTLSTTKKCDATGKTSYLYHGAAKEALLRIKGKKQIYNQFTNKRYKRRQGKAEQCRIYFCKHCKGYHLTSSAAPVTQVKIVKKFQERVKQTNGLVISPDEAKSWKADGLPFPETQKPDT